MRKLYFLFSTVILLTCVFCSNVMASDDIHPNSSTEQGYEYTLTVLANPEAGGTVNGGGTFEAGSYEVTAIAAEGYNFTQWNDGVETNPRMVQLVSDTTLTAEFEEVSTHTVTFCNSAEDGGTVWQVLQVETGETPQYTGETPTKASTAQYDYIFDGWDNAIVPATEDMTYKATFVSQIRKYTITFLDDDSTSVLESKQLVYGAVPVYTGEIPTKESTAKYDYSFVEWYPGFMAVTCDTAYVAVYDSTVRMYTVQFIDDDNTLLYEEDYEYGVVPYMEDPVKEATEQYQYEFVGWDPATIEPVTGPATYKAVYDSTLVQYSITWRSYNGGSYYLTQQYNYGEIPHYEGETPVHPTSSAWVYTFVGWSPNKNDTVNRELPKVTEDEIYYAAFSASARKYAITWTNYDNTVIQVDSVEYNTLPTPPATNPERPSEGCSEYIFRDWGTITNVTKDKTYKAQYNSSIIRYRVTWKNYDGTILRVDSLLCGSVADYGSTPTREADNEYTYMFSTWLPDREALSSDMTYTAQYIYSGYQIRFVNYDGSLLEMKAWQLNETPVYSGPTPTKPASAEYTYTFSNWSPNLVKVTGAATYTAQYNQTANEYTLTWAYNGGTPTAALYTPAGQVAYNSTLKAPVLTRPGYSFVSWNPLVPSRMPATNITFTAQWQARNDVAYTVIHQRQALDGTYPSELTETENFYDGTADQPKTTNVKNYTGFTSPTPTSDTIRANGSTVITYQYTRNSYPLTWNANGGQLTGGTSAGTYLYETPLTAPIATRQGYDFNQWSPEVSATMPAEATTYTAIWTPGTHVRYFVHHFIYRLGNNAILWAGRDTLYGTTGETVYPATMTLEGFTAPAVQPLVITADSMATMQYYYTRNSYTLNWITDGDPLTGTYTHGSVLYEDVIKQPNTPTKTGYTFAAWNPTAPDTMPAANVTLTATWTPNNNTTYYIRHEQQDLNGSTYTLYETDTLHGTTDATVLAARKNYTGFTCTSNQDLNLTILPDGTATLTYKYNRNTYTIRFLNWDEALVDQQSQYFGATPTCTTPNRSATAEWTYYFKAWTPAIHVVNGNQDYKATYDSIRNKYLVTYKNYNGTTLQSDSIEYGQTPHYNGATPVKTATAEWTYSFKAWTPSETTVISAATYTATYDSVRNKYWIVFENYDNTVLQSDSIAYGQTPVYNGATPVKPSSAARNYTFSGWNPTISAVTGNQIYMAQFSSSIRKYQVTYKNYDDSVLVIDSVQYNNKATYSGTTPVKTSTAEWTYSFKSWSPDIETTKILSDQEFKATYDSVRNKYQIRFLNWDGSLVCDTMVEYGLVPSADSIPTKSADAHYTYTFNHWTPAIVSVTGEATYEAVYDSTVNQYTIVFVNDGDTLQQDVLDYDSIPVYTGATPTRPADAHYTYTFNHWTPAIVSVTGDAMYTAEYDSIVNQYTIVFVNDGDTLQQEVLDYDSIPVYTGVAPTRADDVARYSYKWDTINPWLPTYDSIAAGIYVVNKDEMYVAQYMKDSIYHTLLWVTDGDALVGNYSRGWVKYNTEIIQPQTPTKQGYYFANWEPAVPERMPMADTTLLIATWLPDTTTMYEVRHYQQKTDGNYPTIATETDLLHGTTEDTIIPAVRHYEGFTSPNADTAIIAADGSTVVEYFYQRNMTPYQVAHYQQELDGTYALIATDVDTLYALMGSIVMPATKSYAGFVTPEMITDMVAADSSTIINYYYSRQMYALTWVNTFGPLTGNYTHGMVQYGEPIVTPTDPTRTGYTFLDWTPTVSATMPDSNVTYVSRWAQNCYTIVYDGNGADNSVSMANSAMCYDDTIASLRWNEYSKTGYSFAGWALTANGSVVYGNGVGVHNLCVVNGDSITLYAVWTADVNILTWDGNGGLLIGGTPTGPVAFGTELTTPVATRMGYTFVDWQPTVPATMPDSSFYSQVQWRANTYSIHYIATDATAGIMTDDVLTYDVAQSLSANTYVRSGYTFMGWALREEDGVSFVDGETIMNLTATDSAVVTLYAKWQPIHYTIQYDGNGAESGVVASTLHYFNQASALAASTYMRTGYQFVGWAVNSTATTADYAQGEYVVNMTNMADTTITLYAVWQKRWYNLVWNANGGLLQGNGTPAGSTEYSTPIVAQTVTRTGYTFSGWTPEVDATMPAMDMTYVAEWQANTYVVHFDGNGATEGTMADQSMTYGTSTNLAVNAYICADSVFVGWALSPAGMVEYGDAQPVLNMTATDGDTITLYAIWDKNAYTILYNGNGADGGITHSSRHHLDQTEALTPNGYVRGGYSFLGWSLQPNGSVEYTDGQMVMNLSTTAGNTIYLYAVWQPELTQYSVEYYQMNLDGMTYTLYESDTLFAMTESMVMPVVNNYAGFTSPLPQTVQVAGDSTTIVRYYYVRNTYKLDWDLQGGMYEAGSCSVTGWYFYGAAITAPTVSQAGYTFVDWTPSVTGNMPATDITYVAQWLSDTVIYKVYHYLQHTDGSYAAQATEQEVLQGLTGDVVIPSIHSYDGFTSPNPDTITLVAGNVLAVHYYYTRNLDTRYYVDHYLMNLDLTNYTLYETDTLSGMTGMLVSPAVKMYDGFSSPTTKVDTIAGDGSTHVEYYYTRHTNTPYIVEHYGQNLDTTTGYTLMETENMTGITLDTIVPQTKSYEGFTAPTAETAIIAADGSLVVAYYYTRNIYQLVWDAAGGQIDTLLQAFTTGSVLYESAITAPADPTLIGYTFSGWTPETIATTMPDSDLTYTAEWTPNTYVVLLQRPDSSQGGDTSVTVIYDQSMPDVVMPTRTGYEVNGYYYEDTLTAGITWYYDGEGHNVQNWDIAQDSVVLVATMSPKQYVVLFDQHDATIEGDTMAIVTYDSVVPNIVTPSRTGYEFAGYYLAYNSDTVLYFDSIGLGQQIWQIDEDSMTLFATWEARTDIHYQVEHYYELLGGGYASAPDRIDDYYDGVADQWTDTLMRRPQDGFTSPEADSLYILPDGSAVLRYMYTRNIYTIEFFNWDGTLLESHNLYYEDIPVYGGETPTKDSTKHETFVFSGWEPTIHVVDGDEQYVAQYDSILNDDECYCDDAPALELYDWMLMLDVKSLESMGYTFTEEDVTWYRVIGPEPDTLGTPMEARRDEVIGHGFYFTGENPLPGTGLYYAEITLPQPQPNDVYCEQYMRTRLFSYTNDNLVLLPSLVRPGESIYLYGLPIDQETELWIYDSAGHLVRHMTTTEEMASWSTNTTGVYVVKVVSEHLNESLKYIVR